MFKSDKVIMKFYFNSFPKRNNRDFSGMEKEYQKIKIELKNLVPIENTINNARNIEMLHKIIKNNGQNFNLTQEQLDLAKKLSK